MVGFRYAYVRELLRNSRTCRVMMVILHTQGSDAGPSGKRPDTRCSFGGNPFVVARQTPTPSAVDPSWKWTHCLQETVGVLVAGP